jgi:hypothetical protein
VLAFKGGGFLLKRQQGEEMATRTIEALMEQATVGLTNNPRKTTA